MSSTLTNVEKERIEHDIAELYFPNDVSINFQKEIERIYNDYFLTMYPDVKSDAIRKTFIDVSKYGKGLFKIEGPYFRSSFTSCDSLYDKKIIEEKCTIPHFREVLKAYLDFENQKEKFQVLLRTKLSDIRTVVQFRNKLPQFSQFVEGYDMTSDLAVPINLSDIDVIAV